MRENREGSYADVTVDGGVAVYGEVVVVLMDTVSFLSPSAVAQVDEIIGEVCAALACEPYGFGVFWNIHVENVAICKEIVAVDKVENSVKPRLGIGKTLRVSGERDCLQSSCASLENRAVGCRIHYVLAEIQTFVDAGYNKVVCFVQSEGGKAHAIGRGAVNAESANALQKLDLLDFERVVNINGVTFAALLEFGRANCHFAVFSRPFCNPKQAFRVDSVIVCNEYFHSQPVLFSL